MSEESTWTNEIGEIIKRVVDAAHPLRIILFGSAVRGELGPDSDIDILVVVSEGTSRLATTQYLHTQLHGIKASVDILVATQSDLERYADSPGLIYRTILQEGRELYAA